MRKVYRTRSVFRFKRFMRKAYAAFASMHRQVTIGRIAGETADLELLKAGKKTVLGLLFALGGMSAYADEPASPGEAADEQADLEEVLVLPQASRRQQNAYHLVTSMRREDLEALPVQSVADLLQYLPGIDVRTRGAGGAQADLTLRGGTSDQTLILVNGVNLTDPHTGHYSLNLPLSALIIDRVEVLEASDAAYYGSGAFAGAVNLITRPASPTEGHSATASLSGGMYGYANPCMAARWSRKEWSGSVSGEYNRTDGYMANTDLWIAQAFAEASGNGWDLQLGLQAKNAGANGFYSLLSDDQFDATRTAFASAGYQWRAGRWICETGGSWRVNFDRYEWHRGTPSNLHMSNTGEAHARATRYYRHGKTRVGITLRDDNVHSTVLGDPFPGAAEVNFNFPDWRRLPYAKNRLGADLCAAHTVALRDLTLSVSLNGMWNSMCGWNMGGGFQAGYRIGRSGTLHFNANRSARTPTFTDLYYHSAAQQANPDLKAETAWTLDAGGGYNGERWEAQASVYRRWGRDIIDWVKRPGDEVWVSENRTSVNSTGCEMQASYRLNQWLRLVRVSYAFCVNDKESGDWLSLYALDFLRHKASVTIDHGLYKGLGASWTLTFTQRNGDYETAGGTTLHQPACLLLDGKVYWENRRFYADVSCTNMTNRVYYGQGGVLQPGAWAKATLRVKF